MAGLCSHTLHDAGQCRSGLPLCPDGLLLAKFNEHSACALGMGSGPAFVACLLVALVSGMGATQPERMRNVLHTDGAGAV